MSKEIIIIGTPSCSYCLMAKDLVATSEYDARYLDLFDLDLKDQKYYQEVADTMFRTVPQTFLYQKDLPLVYIGGYEALRKYLT